MSSTDEDPQLLSRRAALKALAAVSVCPLVASCEFVELKDDDDEASTTNQSSGNDQDAGHGTNGDTGGDTDTVPVDGTPFSLDDPELEALSEVGNQACFDHGSQEVILVRASDDEIVAFEQVCPHQGLPMGACGNNTQPAKWDQDKEAIVCQWHGSTFNRDGDLIEAPPTDSSFDEPIRVFPVQFDPDTGEGYVLN